MKKDWFTVLLNIFLFILYYMILGGGLQALGAVLTGADLNNPYQPLSTFQHLVISSLDFLAAAFLTWYFLKRSQLSFKHLGFGVNVNQLTQAFVLGGIFIALAFIAFNLLGYIEIQPLPFNIAEFATITLFLFVAALSEEIIFRGFFMVMIQKYIGNGWAILISSLLFSLFHIFNPNVSFVGLLEIFLAGVALAYAYFKTGNIWFITVMHFAWNYCQTLLGFNVSGIDFYSFLEFSYIREGLITGGKFGFEGSVFSPFVEVITIYILTFYNNRKLQF